jgi:MtN3/saliva family.
MISMTFVCSTLWLIYGYMLGDPFIQVRNYILNQLLATVLIK